MRQESTRIPKMIASRSLIFPARQCLRVANASRPWIPAIAPIAQVRDVSIACASFEDDAYTSASFKTQFRSYSIPYEDKVAKFTGKKGSDVCDTQILKGPACIVCLVDNNWKRILRSSSCDFRANLQSH